MLSLLEPVIAQALMEGLAQRKQRGGKAGFVLVLAAALLATAGVLLLVYALYGGLLTYFTAPKAALAAGVITLLCALLCALGAAMVTDRRRKKHIEQLPALAETIQKSLAQLGHELEVPVRDNPGTALLLAGLAGFMSGKRLH